MDFWSLLEYVAWIISLALLGWMVLDALRVRRDYAEDILTSSREGEIESFSEKHEL